MVRLNYLVIITVVGGNFVERFVPPPGLEPGFTV